MTEPTATEPKVANADPPARASDWYELFFDLVFVVAVAIAAETIEKSPTFGTTVTFILLFIPLWWAWVNLMVSNNLWGPRFPSMGLLIVCAMPGPAMMAIAISVGIEKDAWLYAIGGTWIRLVLLAIWIVPRAKREFHVKLWRLLTYNLVTAAVWLASIAVPPPFNYLFWAVAIVAEVGLLSIRRGFGNAIYDRASVSHFLDRIGLFVVIVIGEAVYLAVTGVAAHPSFSAGVTAFFGFVGCALLARAFFHWGIPEAERQFSSAQRTQSYAVMRDATMYLPFLLVTALTLVAASIGIAVADPDAPLPLAGRVLLACGVGGFFLGNAVIGIRLGQHLGRMSIFTSSSFGLTAIACFAFSGPAWSTLGWVAFALVLLDLLSKALARSHHAN